MEKFKLGNWRALLAETGIIVLGVSIALIAQQSVDAWNDRQRATTARAAVHSEIARNLAFMNLRQGTESCMAKRLDEVDGLIAASAGGKLPQDPIWIGVPMGVLMQDGKYKAAMQSGSITLLPSREQGYHSNLYSLFETYNQNVMQEYAAWAELRALEKHPPASPVLDGQLRSAVQKARSMRWGLQMLRAINLRDAAELGIKPDRREWSEGSVCLPLRTIRAEALKALHAIKGRFPGIDQP